MKKILCCFCMCTALFFSCKTTSTPKHIEKDACMFIMIYDYANNGVNDVILYKDGKAIGMSDIRGRYIIDKDAKTDFQLRFEKKGYEDVQVDVHFDPFSVLYVKMGTAAQFLRLAEEHADSYMYESALDYVERALGIEHERNDILYFKAVILYKMQRLEEAQAILTALKQKNVDSEYIKRFEQKISDMQGINK